MEAEKSRVSMKFTKGSSALKTLYLAHLVCKHAGNTLGLLLQHRLSFLTSHIVNNQQAITGSISLFAEWELEVCWCALPKAAGMPLEIVTHSQCNNQPCDAS
jgi:hypothetical protein